MLGRNHVAIGDVRELAGRLEPGSVQTIVTSPPYFGLRDYGTATWEGGDAACDHRQAVSYKSSTLGASTGGRSEATHRRSIEAQASAYRGTCGKCGATRVDRQLGLEATPAEYVANLVAVFRALRPALKDDGTIWLNLGDSYNAYNGNRGASRSLSASRDEIMPDLPTGHGLTAREYPNKCLLGIPWRVAFALVDDGWILRSDIIWAKPAPMPESVTDRPTRSHEYLFLLSKRPNYYYDAEAIREPQTGEIRGRQPSVGPKALAAHQGIAHDAERMINHRSHTEVPGGRNKRTVWTVNSAPFPDAHYATFPPALIRPCVLAGTSERGECARCGTAWGRVVERENYAIEGRATDTYTGKAYTTPHSAPRGPKANFGMPRSTTTGWAPQCACPPGTPTRPQVVLDPFMGSGTTAQVAHELGRDWLGFDLDERALKWTADRLARFPVGMLPGLAG